MPEKLRSMALRASQQEEGRNDSMTMMTVGSPRPTRARSAERSSFSSGGASSFSRDLPTTDITRTDSNQSDPSGIASGSLNIGSSGSGNHRRSNSDPFDDGGDELVRVSETGNDGVEKRRNDDGTNNNNKVQALPTLHRFPCMQTRNQNCWSESPTEMFEVRGPNYVSGDKIKIPCKNYLLSSRGCDLFLTDDNNSMLDISKYVILCNKYHVV
jgi:hypothetical protein